MPVPKARLVAPANAHKPSAAATPEGLTPSAGGRPDKKAYDAEQENFKKEIDGLQRKLAAVKEKIGQATEFNTGYDRRHELKSELESIRNQQWDTRGRILEQVKALQDGIQNKVKDLQAAKLKIRFKTVAEVDAHIKNLDQQVESGNLRIADEKRAVQDISSAKRIRRTVEAFQADQDAIDADRKSLDELRVQLDDPQFKAMSDRRDEIEAELEKLKREHDEASAGRAKLIEERDQLQANVNLVYNQKRESAQRFKNQTDHYWAKVNEDRARRAERIRAQRAAEDFQRKQDEAERLREEALLPAFQAQIEDCQTLIDYFSGKSSTASNPLTPRSVLAGVPKLEIRQVAAAPEGSVALKKKSEEEDAYFIGGKGKANKGKKSAPKLATPPDANAPLNVPLPTLSALLSLSIPPPASTGDVPRVVEDLRTKKAWFEVNQARVTAENVAKAESDIQRLSQATHQVKNEGAPDAAENTNGDATGPETAAVAEGDLVSAEW